MMERVGQGRDKTIRVLEENQPMLERLRMDVRARNGLEVPVMTGEPAEG